MRSIDFASLLIVSGTLVGCGDGGETFDVDEADLEANAELGLVEENAIHPNAIHPNAIHPNAIHPNAIHPNALTPSAFSPSTLAALQDPGEAGHWSRMFVRYAVSCAFEPSQSFTFSWTDALGLVQTETYVGKVGLAPGWATGPLNESGQRWVSACLAARTNWYGVTVTISMRGNHDAIKPLSPLERLIFAKEEGAFWGNLFSGKPYMNACVYVPNADYARTVLRDCAAGHIGPDGLENCGIIERRGSCDAMCDSLDTNNGFRPKCVYDATVAPPRKTTEIMTVFLL